MCSYDEALGEMMINVEQFVNITRMAKQQGVSQKFKAMIKSNQDQIKEEMRGIYQNSSIVTLWELTDK